MEVIKITPRGYCHGVVTAMNIVAKALDDPTVVRPLYLLGEIVHNRLITNAFSEAGLTTLLNGSNRRELLEQVDSGTIIITAHGIDPNLIVMAQEKNLDIIDATCSDVHKTHDIIKSRLSDNYYIFYVGKKNHPEPEGAIGIDPQRVLLITNEKDIDNLTGTFPKICITNQTTMSMWDVQNLMNYAKKKYPHLEIINEICKATSQRQQATFLQAKEADLTLVVGDQNSNNTNKLVEVSKKMSKTPAIRISSLNELDYNWLLDPTIKKVAITSGASTPTLITQEVISYVQNFDPQNSETWDLNSKIPLKRLIPRNRSK